MQSGRWGYDRGHHRHQLEASPEKKLCGVHEVGAARGLSEREEGLEGEGGAEDRSAGPEHCNRVPDGPVRGCGRHGLFLAQSLHPTYE